MPRFRDLSLSPKFGMLKAIQTNGKARDGNYLWLCKCDCGAETTVASRDLIQGKTKSCGCDKGAAIARSNYKHGRSHTPEYNSWASMIQRCTNPNCEDYPDYGGRGIRVFDEWLHSFDAFFRYAGARPSGKYSLDRKNVNGNYEPGNVRWASDSTQSNNRRTNRLITLCGETRTVAEWSARSGVPYKTIIMRLNKGWDHEDAIFWPVGQKRED